MANATGRQHIVFLVLRGALPGDPFVDYVFMLIACQMFRQIETAAGSIGLCALACSKLVQLLASADEHWHSELPISVPVVDDDGALVVEAPAHCIVQDIAALAAVAGEAARAHCLKLSDKPGKTEVLVAPAGK